MNAGRELDALVASKVLRHVVMGEAVLREKMPPRTPGDNGGVMSFDSNPPMYPWPLPHYSTDIAAAWEVVEKLMAAGYVVEVHAFPPDLDPTTPRYQAVIRRNLVEVGTSGPNDPRVEGPAHAVCLIALKAVGHATAGDYR